MSKKQKPEVVPVGDAPVRLFPSKDRAKIAQRIRKRNERLRGRFPEVHGKVVDFIDQSIEDGSLYISVRFKDQTDFCLRYTSKLFAEGAEYCHVELGDYDVIRRYR